MRLFGECATAFDRIGKRVQQLFGTFPRHAGVGDGFAVLELVERSGLLIEDDSTNISPTIYLEEYYQQFLSGKRS